MTQAATLQSQHQNWKQTRLNLNRNAKAEFDRPINIRPWRDWPSTSKTKKPEAPKAPEPIRSYAAKMIAPLVEQNNILSPLMTTPRRANKERESINTARFLRKVVEMVAEKEGVLINEIMSDRRQGSIVTARQIVCYLACAMTDYSLPRIGRFLNRDHTTILHGRNKMREKMGGSPGLTARVSQYIEDLKPIAPTLKINVNNLNLELSGQWIIGRE